jgi:anti-anti-sigma factor
MTWVVELTSKLNRGPSATDTREVRALPETDPVIRVSGQLDVDSLPQLREALKDAFLNTTSEVVVDFADVSFCDAAPLGVLAVTGSALTERGSRLVLRNVRPRQAKVIRLCGLSSLLADAPSPNKAS